MVKDNLTAIELEEHQTNCEQIWVKVQLKKAKELFVSCFYMPHRDMNVLLELQKSIESVNPKGQRNIVVLGDFNCPDISWDYGYTAANAPNKNVQDKLIELSVENSLCQLVSTMNRLVVKIS